MTFNKEYVVALAFVTEHAKPRLDLIRRGVVVPEHPDQFESLLLPYEFLTCDNNTTVKVVLQIMAVDLAKSWVTPDFVELGLQNQAVMSVGGGK